LQLFGVRECNQELCVVCKKKPDFDCVVEKNKNTDEARKLNCKKQDFWQCQIATVKNI
jgi:hypothetical protein